VSQGGSAGSVLAVVSGAAVVDVVVVLGSSGGVVVVVVSGAVVDGAVVLVSGNDVVGVTVVLVSGSEVVVGIPVAGDCDLGVESGAALGEVGCVDVVGAAVVDAVVDAVGVVVSASSSASGGSSSNRSSMVTGGHMTGSLPAAGDMAQTPTTRSASTDKTPIPFTLLPMSGSGYREADSNVPLREPERGGGR
jgi:hypothetical protein